MKNAPLLSAHLGLIACLGTLGARADVTIEQKTDLDVSSVVRMNGTTKTSIAGDKRREESESHCEGMMSLLCGNLRSAQIVRLDRGLTWQLQPAKKTYREELFATPEQIAEMRARMQATMEKMRSCPTQRVEAADKSKCEMSAPKVEVHKTTDKMDILGHVAQRTAATLTESCTNHDTGEVCETVIAFDLWLTQDKMPGAADRHAFEQAYAKKLGLDDPQGVMRGAAAKFLAPYQAQIKELTDKADDFKGQPLKTTMRIMMGGPQCKAQSRSAAGGSEPNPANPMANVAQASKALGNIVGSMFRKKKADDSAAASAASADAPASAALANPADPYAQYLKVAAFSSETVTVDTDNVPADRFEVPADWKKETPKASGKDNEEYTCPKSGS